MTELLILSGKGGTGKTTIAAAFTALAKPEAIADCDVDAPNLHLVSQYGSAVKEEEFIGGVKAKITADICVRCGACHNHCRFHAIQASEEGYTVLAHACEGCGLCERICPAQAISMVEDLSGYTAIYGDENILSTATLKMGRGNSGKLVTQVKDNMKSVKGEAPLAIIDGSPGIGCPVIASISGVDYVLLVAEASLSGLTDLGRIVDTSRIFGPQVLLCINKYDMNEEMTAKIEAYAREEAIPIVGKIPYDSHVSEAMNAGKSIVEYAGPAQSAIEGMYKKVMTYVGQ